jgi:uncharacterized protein YyaL (SSP411 family)
VRLKRSRPHRDEKIVTAWNGLMITAFVKAGVQLKNRDYLNAAERALLFIKKHLYDSERGRLFRSVCSGRRIEHGFAEDYAFLIQGLLDFYEATSEKSWLIWAEELQEKMKELFWDHKQGGYFSSAEGDPHLLVRIKEEYDGAEPSANAIAASNLQRLSQLSLSLFSYATAMAEQIFQSMGSTLNAMPTAVPQLLIALSDSLQEHLCTVDASGSPHCSLENIDF